MILSAGSLATPQLLLLSGIGPAAALTAKGIEVKYNNPNVGSNLIVGDDPASFVRTNDSTGISGPSLGRQVSLGAHSIVVRQEVTMLGFSVNFQ